MKLCLAIVCACIVSSLGSVLPGPVVKGVAVGVGKGAAAQAKAGDTARDWRRTQGSVQDWANADQKSAQTNKDWDQTARSASGDANSAAQDWSKDSSRWEHDRDASNRAGGKAAANNAARDGKAAWHASNNFDKNQDWARNGGWKNGNKRHESIGYSFDKSYNRNANDNGGFDAGSSMADRAVDDQGSKSSSYDSRKSDHSARAGNADAQSADRSAGYGNGAWRNANAADRNNRNWRQSAGANANNVDWAEKRDSSQAHNRASEDQRSRAADVLADRSNVDRNADRASAAQGNTLGVRRPLGGKGYGYGGKGYGHGGPGAYGYAGVAGPAGGHKGYARNGAAADASRVADNANRNRQQNWDGTNWEDRSKDSGSRDQWQSDAIQGFNRDQAATLWDNAAAANSANRNQGARAGDRQWADAKATKAASQGRHDFDETDWKNANQKWNKADRDHKRNEWKKFFSNDKTGGENTERLWYDRGQTDNSASADFANQKDNSARWQDANQYDARAQRAHGSDYARANEARNRQWDSDSSQDRNGRDQQRAAASDSANRGRWGSDNDNRDYKVDQSRHDDTRRGEQTYDRDAYRNGHDSRAFGGARRVYGAGPVNPGYGYNGGYGGYNGYRGNYGAPFNRNYGGYGYGAPFGKNY